MYRSTKTYGHDIGLSCAFRQWRANSHCNQIHGYALAVKVVFEAATLDEYNWVIDFGSMKDFKAWLQETFDHKLLVASDDPMRMTMLNLGEMGVANVVMVDDVGCEAFAELIYWRVHNWLADREHGNRVVVRSVTVAEHGANSASYIGAGAVPTIPKPFNPKDEIPF